MKAKKTTKGPSKDISILILETGEFYVMWNKRIFAYVIKLMNLRWENDPRLFM